MSSEVTLEYAQGKTTTEFNTFEEAVMFMKDVAGDASVRELKSVNLATTYLGVHRMGFYEEFVNTDNTKENIAMFVLHVMDDRVEMIHRVEQNQRSKM